MGSRSAGPEAASEGSGRYHRARAGSESPPAAEKRSRETGRGAGRRTNHRCRGGSGEHSPSSSQPQPAEPRRGASIPAARPLRPAPRTAALTAHRTGPPSPARSPPLPRRRAVFLAALLLSPSCRALQIPPKRGYAGGGARMLVRASLPPRIHERRRGGARGRNLLLYSFIFTVGR